MSLFPVEEPPTLPQRGRSGSSIKGSVVRAMQRQLDAEKRAGAALDQMMDSIRRAETVPPPPRRPNGRYQG